LQVVQALPRNDSFILNAVIDWSVLPITADGQPAPVQLTISLAGPSAIAFNLPDQLSVQVDNTQCASGVYIFMPNTTQGVYVGARRRKRVTLLGNFSQGFLVYSAGTVTIGKTSILIGNEIDATWDDFTPADMTGSNGFNPVNTTEVKILTTGIDVSTHAGVIGLIPAGYSILGVGVEMVGVTTGVGGSSAQLELIGANNIAPFVVAGLVFPASLANASFTLMPYVEMDGLVYAGALNVIIQGPLPTSGIAALTLKVA